MDDNLNELKRIHEALDKCKAEIDIHLIEKAYSLGEENKPQNIAAFIQELPGTMIPKICEVFEESFDRLITLKIDSSGVEIIMGKK